ncbi:hypothetical protein BS17DRAFT_765195 [Gyrodon lividus]|nr:hypothetical protein BS17DRAFT_765195 [Gyrodon lividus]
MTKLCETEWKLRKVQADNALVQLRQQLCLKHYLTNFKKEWITGQWASTCSQTIMKTVQAKIDFTVGKYWRAPTTLGLLAIPLVKVDWDTQFPPSVIRISSS